MAENKEELGIVITTHADKGNSAVKKTIDLIKRLANSIEQANNKVKKMPKHFEESKDKAKKLEQIFNIISVGKFIWLANSMKNLARHMGDLIEKTAKYQKAVENFNYAFGADDSIFERATEFQEKMVSTFGLVESEVKATQTAMYNMVTSLGNINRDTAELISENLTKMIADYASKYALTIEESATKMKSALVGETEAIRKEAGLDITDQTLTLKLQDMGIDKTSSQLNQMEKRLLRIIVLQEQFDKAGIRGNYANTLEGANIQLQMMRNQLTEIVTWTGNLITQAFSGMFEYINGFLMAIKEVLKAIAQSMGFVVKGASGNLSDILGTEEAASGVDDVTSAVKRLSTATTGIDELNIISPDTGGAGAGAIGGDLTQYLLDNIGEYDNLMDRVTNKAKDTRDKIMDWLGFIEIDGGWKLGEGWTNFDSVLLALEGVAAILGGLIMGKIINAFSTIGLKASLAKGIGLGIVITFGIDALAKLNKFTTTGEFDAKDVAKTILDDIFVGAGIGLLAHSVEAGMIAATIGLSLTLGTTLGLKIRKEIENDLNGDTLAGRVYQNLKSKGMIGEDNSIAIRLGAGIIILWAKVLDITKIVDFVDWLNKIINEDIGWIIDEFHQRLEKSKENIIKIIDNVKQGFEKSVEGIKRIFSGIIEFITGVFSLDWEKAWNGIVDTFTGIFDLIGIGIKGAINVVIIVINKFLDGLETAINFVIHKINQIKINNPFTGEEIWSPSVSEISIKHIQLVEYAKGGFPKMGSMFIANEAGPELVGKIGNDNAVVNNQQIIEGVSQGVFQAVSEAMQQNKTKTIIQIDGKAILSATERATRSRGANMMGGAFANA